MAGLFGTQHSKREFKYKPRFYDENMEDLRKRVQKLKEEMGEAEKKGFKPGSTIKGAFTTQFKPKRSEEQIRLRNRNIRLFVMFVLLAIAAYYILIDNKMEEWLFQINRFSNGR